VLIELKEQGKKSIYAEAIEVKNGEISDEQIVAYIKSKQSLLFKEQNRQIIEDIISFILAKKTKFSLKEFDEDKLKKDNLKKLFGETLEIV
jgi:hypothetical protein